MWLKVTVLVPEPLADSVAALFAALAENGVEYGFTSPGEPVTLETVSAYLEDDDTLAEKLAVIKAHLDQLRQSHPQAGDLPLTTEPIADTDWNATWKKEFVPFAITPTLVIKPTWEDYQPKAGEKVIEMDPGMAFGTGHHASTRLALALLETLFSGPPKPETVLDVGCGTGILAMAAALWGAKRVTAIDNDPEAVTVARENVAANRLEHLVAVGGGPLTALAEPFAVVIANITQDVLLALAPELTRLVRPGGRLIMAGILSGEQAENIHRCYSGLGFSLQLQPVREEWTAFLFRRQGHTP